MKSALVLGLALAANAQVDNELATSLPYNPSGADLVRNAGWGRHLPIHTPPKHTTPIYSTRYDEVADDELATLPYHLSGADLVKYAKEAQQTVYRPTAHVVRDDEGDDELMVYYTKDSQGNKHYEGGYTVRRDDAADDELAAFPSHPSGADLVRNAGWGRHLPIHTPPKHTNPTYSYKYDDAADDELATLPYHLSGADLVKYAKEAQQTVYRPTAHVVRDDADDELAAFPSHPSGADLVRNAGWGRHLPIHTPPKYTNPTYSTRYDEVADDELATLPYHLSGADLVKYAKEAQQTVYRPTAHVVRDDADDELMVYYTKDSQGHIHYVGGPTVRRDDEADDELVQTFYSPSGADLVKYAKQSQQTVYRPTAHVVSRDDADDELAYLGHLIRETQPEKIEKKTHQMPEIRRHFRHVEKN